MAAAPGLTANTYARPRTDSCCTTKGLLSGLEDRDTRGWRVPAVAERHDRLWVVVGHRLLALQRADSAHRGVEGDGHPEDRERARGEADRGVVTVARHRVAGDGYPVHLDGGGAQQDAVTIGRRVEEGDVVVADP